MFLTKVIHRAKIIITYKHFNMIRAYAYLPRFVIPAFAGMTARKRVNPNNNIPSLIALH